MPSSLPDLPDNSVLVSARSNNTKEHYESVHLDIRRYTCSVEGCPKACRGFRRKADLHAHMNTKHL